MFPDNFEITSVPSKTFCSFISKSFSEKSYGGTIWPCSAWFAVDRKTQVSTSDMTDMFHRSFYKKMKVIA